jgi:hypothetical protein
MGERRCRLLGRVFGAGRQNHPVRGNCRVVHYHQVRQEPVLVQQACPKPKINQANLPDFSNMKSSQSTASPELDNWIAERRKNAEVNIYQAGDKYVLEIKNPNKIHIQFFDQKSQKWQLVPDEKLGAFNQNKEKIKERETMSAPTTTAQPKIPTTTVVAKSTQAVSRELNTNTNTIGSQNPVTESRSQDSYTSSSTRNSHNSDSRDQSSDHHNVQPQNSHNSDSRYQGRNSHNNVTINDDHSVVNDNSTNIKIGKYVDRSLRGKGNVIAGRDSSDNDSSSVKNTRSDDHSTRSWRSKKAKSSSEANGNQSSESTENKNSVDNSKKIKKKNKKEKAVVPAQEPAPAQEPVQSTPQTVR